MGILEEFEGIVIFMVPNFKDLDVSSAQRPCGAKSGHEGGAS
jgi:hypothetical protein